MKLVVSHTKNSELQQAFLDLDIVKLLRLCAPDLTEEAALDWALCYFESDIAELSARYQLFHDLSDTAAAKAAYEAVCALRDELDKQKRSADTFHEVLYTYRVLKAFLQLIEALDALTSGTLTSDRLKSLRSLLQEIRKDPVFTQIRSVADQVPRTLPLSRHFYVGINTRETGDATEIGVIRDDVETTESEPLLAQTAPSASSTSLFPAMKYTRAGYGTHFEEYLLQHYEKHYHSEIMKVHKLLQSVRPMRTDELLELEDSLHYLVVGLQLKDAFTDAGYTLCLPDPSGESLASEKLMYPDLALHLANMEGKTVTLPAASSTLITGANHSGKTSYLKTIGQSLILAQLGLKVPAVSFRFRPFRRFHTLFSSGEDSSMTVSRMGVEIQRLSNIMQQATAEDLVLINEPMTSTNPIEAVSICGDLMQRFLNASITHIVVTHLYDIYYLLKARLSPEEARHFISLITVSAFHDGEGMEHTYRLKESAPLGNSYAMETAKSFQITLEDLLDDPDLMREASAYCRTEREENMYEGGAGHGLSDTRA